MVAERVQLDIEASEQSIRSMSEKVTKAIGLGGGIGRGIGFLMTSTLRDMGMVAGGAGMVGRAIDTMKPYVQTANPVVNERMDMIMERIEATIGHTFIPVMEALMPLVEGFGEALAQAMPSAEQVSKVMDKLAPSIEIVSEWLMELGKGIGQFVDMMVPIMSKMAEWLHHLLILIDLMNVPGYKTGKTRGWNESEEDFATRNKYGSTSKRDTDFTTWGSTARNVGLPVVGQQAGGMLGSMLGVGGVLGSLIGAGAGLVGAKATDESKGAYEARLAGEKKKGMAVPYRQAQYSSAEDLSRQLYLSAASGSGKVEDQQLDALKQIVRNTTKDGQEIPAGFEVDPS